MIASWSGSVSGPTEYKYAAQENAPYGRLPSARLLLPKKQRPTTVCRYTATKPLFATTISRPTATQNGPVRLRGTENRHKGFQKSHSEVGLRRGLRPPFATVSGRAKSYRPRKLICRQISGERWAISALSLLTP